MTKLSMGTSFAQLFKKYRLRSEIETLSEFGDLLAEEGFVYETSLFTRWQKGDRIPKERAVLLAILSVFMKRGGIVSIEEANSLIESVNQRSLTYEESSSLSEFIQSTNTKTLPVKPNLFVGREELLKDLSWELINKRNVLLYGMPGVGKTYIAIYLAHQLKSFFSDGIFWFRADLKSFDDIVDELLKNLGGASFVTIQKRIKLEKLTQILSKRHILLILDNVNSFAEKELKTLISLPVTLLITAIDTPLFDKLQSFRVDTFTESEFLQLCEIVLGKPYVRINQEEIFRIGQELGLLPISSVLSVKQIYSEPIKIKEYIKKIQDEMLNIRAVAYDDKTLFAAIDIAFNRLQQRTKNLLISCAAFEGTDFGIQALSWINNLSQKETKNSINELMQLSLIEYSNSSRYRLHPVIREFLLNFIRPTLYTQLSKFYIRKIDGLKAKDDKYFRFFSRENENILALIRRDYQYKKYHYISKIWPLISGYIFISGKWEVIHNYDYIIQNSYRFEKDDVGRAIYLIEDLGRVYFFQKSEQKLQALFKECIHIAAKHKHKLLEGLIMQKQGIVSLYSDELEAAKHLLLKTIKALSKSDYKEQLYKSYAYLGMTYAKLGMYDVSVSNIQKALKNIKGLQDDAVIGFIYLYLGNSYLKMNNCVLAEKYLLLALKNAKESNVLIEHALALEGLSLLYSLLDKNDKRSKIHRKEAQAKFKLLGMDRGSKFFQ